MHQHQGESGPQCVCLRNAMHQTNNKQEQRSVKQSCKKKGHLNAHKITYYLRLLSATPPTMRTSTGASIRAVALPSLCSASSQFIYLAGSPHPLPAQTSTLWKARDT